MKMGEAMYQAQQTAGASEAGMGGDSAANDSSGSANDEKVVDAEFEEVKEDKK